MWVDVPAWDDEAAAVLTERFGIHERAVRGLRPAQSRCPRCTSTRAMCSSSCTRPERGARGHVHYVELDQFVGPNWLITVHGPVNPAVAARSPCVETRAVARRLETGRLRPSSAADLSFALVTALTGRMRDLLFALTEEVWQLERQVTGGQDGDPEQFLEELFATRHGLLAVAHDGHAEPRGLRSDGHAGRLARRRDGPAARPGGPVPPDRAPWPQGQRDYLQGVIEFYQARTNTKMTIAAERLAVIAAVTLPVTALSSIFGMNVIVNDSTHVGQLVVLLAIMGVMSATLLIWARRKGWW